MSRAFREQYDLDERRRKSEALRLANPDRIPIICEKLPSSDLPSLESDRLLVPASFTVGNLTTIIRSRVKISSQQSIFLFVKNALLPVHQSLDVIYEQHRDPDGFLYILYSGENTFGALALMKY